MKSLKWEKRVCGSIYDCPSTFEKMLYGNEVVAPRMDVCAKLKGECIRLRILREIEADFFKASVMGHYFLGTPDELNDGDEVRIGREHIHWLYIV